jgi:hypothetical protein
MDCGKPTAVPFKPTAENQLLRECLGKHRSPEAEHKGSSAEGNQTSMVQTKNRLEIRRKTKLFICGCSFQVLLDGACKSRLKLRFPKPNCLSP